MWLPRKTDGGIIGSSIVLIDHPEMRVNFPNYREYRKTIQITQQIARQTWLETWILSNPSYFLKLTIAIYSQIHHKGGGFSLRCRRFSENMYIYWIIKLSNKSYFFKSKKWKSITKNRYSLDYEYMRLSTRTMQNPIKIALDSFDFGFQLFRKLLVWLLN